MPTNKGLNYDINMDDAVKQFYKHGQESGISIGKGISKGFFKEERKIQRNITKTFTETGELVGEAIADGINRKKGLIEEAIEDLKSNKIKNIFSFGDANTKKELLGIIDPIKNIGEIAEKASKSVGELKAQLANFSAHVFTAEQIISPKIDDKFKGVIPPAPPPPPLSTPPEGAAGKPKPDEGKISSQERINRRLADTAEKASGKEKEINEILQYREYLSDEIIKDLEENKNSLRKIIDLSKEQITSGTATERGLLKINDAYDELLEKKDEFGETLEDKVKAEQTIFDLGKKDINREKLHEKLFKKDTKSREKLRKKFFQEERAKRVSYKQAKENVDKKMPKQISLADKLKDKFEGIKFAIGESKLGKLTQGLKKAKDVVGESFVGKAAGALGLGGLGAGLAMGGIAAFIAAMLSVDKKVKDAKREIIGLMGATGELGRSTDVYSGQIQSSINDMYSAYRNMGIGFDEAKAGMISMGKAGYNLDTFLNQNIQVFRDFYAQTVMTGKSIDELTGIGASLREEYGMRLPNETVDAFRDIRSGAIDAGIATSRFFDKVMNAATGMGIYGYKIKDVSNTFSKLSKNMGMSEKQSTEAADAFMKSFDTLSQVEKFTAAQITGLSGALSGKTDKKTGQIIFSEKSLKILKDRGLSDEQIKELSKIKSYLARVAAAHRMMPLVVKGLDYLKYQGQSSGVYLNTNAKTQKEMEKLLSDMTEGQYKLLLAGKIDEKTFMGYQSMFKTLVAQGKWQIQNNTQTFKDEKTAWDSLQAIVGEDEQGKQIVSNLKQQFDEQQKNDPSVTIDRFIKGIDTSLMSIKDIDKKIATLQNKQAETRQTEALKKSTQSMTEAIESAVGEILKKIYNGITRVARVLEWKFGMEDEAKKTAESDAKYDETMKQLGETIKSQKELVGQKKTMQTEYSALEQLGTGKDQKQIERMDELEKELQNKKYKNLEKELEYNEKIEVIGKQTVENQEKKGNIDTAKLTGMQLMDVAKGGGMAQISMLEDVLGIKTETTTPESVATPYAAPPSKPIYSIFDKNEPVFRMVPEKGLERAKGGVATSPTLGIIGEAGPEALIPLDRFGDMVKKYVKSAKPTSEEGKVVSGHALVKTAEKGAEMALHSPIAKKIMGLAAKGAGKLVGPAIAAKSAWEAGQNVYASASGKSDKPVASGLLNQAGAMGASLPWVGAGIQTFFDTLAAKIDTSEDDRKGKMIAQAMMGPQSLMPSAPILQPPTDTKQAQQNTINDNRNIVITVNQRDQKSVEQAIRKEIYVDKLKG